MRKFLLLFLLTLGLLVTPGYAVVVDLTLVTPTSSANRVNFDIYLENTATFGGGSDTAQITTTADGNMLGNFDYGFSTSNPNVATLTQFELTGGEFNINDIPADGQSPPSVTIPVAYFPVTATVTSSGLGGTFDTPNPPDSVSNGANAYTKNFDATHHEAILNQGTIDLNSPAYNYSVDFSTDQEAMTPDSGTGTITTTLHSQTGKDYTYKVHLELPIEIVKEGEYDIEVANIAYDVTGTGNLVAEGYFTEHINAVPVANDNGYLAGDSTSLYSVHIGDTLSIGFSNSILANDTDADDLSSSLTAHLVSAPTAGTVNLDSSWGSFTYNPTDSRYDPEGNRGTVGIDSFTYRASDGYDSSNEATVSINVFNNDADAVDDSYSMYQYGDLIADAIDIDSVLKNDSDGDDDSFIAALRTDPLHGELTLDDDGTFTYTPDDGFSGTDSFTYYADDGWTALDDLDWATVTIEVDEVIPGDANHDNKVDGSDVTILANNWQKGVSTTEDVSWEMGDFNRDGKVDGSDVTILANNWQEGVNMAKAAVPEPGTLALLLSAVFGLALIHRKR